MINEFICAEGVIITNNLVKKMTNQYEQLAKLRFDDSNSFNTNCEEFLTILETVDAEMAGILRDNWDTLLAIVSEGGRNTRTRSEFNTSIATALDALVTLDSRMDGE